MMTTEEIIKIMRANKEGKRIESLKNCTSDWCLINGKIDWDFENYIYRISAHGNSEKKMRLLKQPELPSIFFISRDEGKHVEMIWNIRENPDRTINTWHDQDYKWSYIERIAKYEKWHSFMQDDR